MLFRSRSTNGWLVIPVGLAYAVVYYAVFDFCIRRFNLKTPGREDVATAEKVVLTENERASAYIKALGGAENLLTVGACTTRLRLEMVDRNKASDADLKALGAMAVVRPGKGGSLQVVVGPMADSIADEIRLAMPSLGRAVLVETAVVADEPKAFVVASSEAQQWLNALGGGDNVLQLDCIAMSRIRLLLADGKALSDAQLKELGCQGVSQLEGGVWHLLVGDKAASLSGALEALLNRIEPSAKVLTAIKVQQPY